MRRWEHVKRWRIRAVLGWIAIVAAVLTVLFALVAIWTTNQPVALRLMNTSGVMLGVAAVATICWGIGWIVQEEA